MTSGTSNVSEVALYKRINRRLSEDGRKLCKSRGSWNQYELGEYYVIDIRGNFIVWKHFDIRDLAIDLKVLYPWELNETANAS